MNEIETRIVEKMIELAKANGFVLRGIFDGRINTKTDRPEVIVAHLGNLEQGWVRFGAPEGSVARVFNVLLIPGNDNDGRDIVADYNFDEPFERLVMNPLQEFADTVQEADPKAGVLLNPPL